jgi:hypothetical protein
MSLWNFGNSPLLSSRAIFLAEALLRGPDATVGEAGTALIMGRRYPKPPLPRLE